MSSFFWGCFIILALTPFEIHSKRWSGEKLGHPDWITNLLIVTAIALWVSNLFDKHMLWKKIISLHSCYFLRFYSTNGVLCFMAAGFLAVVPDSGPNIPATPDLSRWQTMYNIGWIGFRMVLGTKIVNLTAGLNSVKTSFNQCQRKRDNGKIKRQPAANRRLAGGYPAVGRRLTAG